MASLTRPARGSTTRQRRAAVEQRVLDAVEGLLHDGESFTALPVARIADAAGMARTTFYGHFPDKATLLIRLVDSATESIFARARAWLADDAASWREHVAVIEEIVAERRRHGALLDAFDEVAAYDPDVARHGEVRMEAVTDALRGRIERDRAAELVAAPIDAAITAAVVTAGTRVVIARQATHAPPATDRAFAEGLARGTWVAIGRAL